jgi:HAD superfamily hydrolase (TIGR01484 family)
MRPIEALDSAEARRLTGFLFDLDDTLLDDGELGEDAYRALFRLRESGLWLVAVTGRPSGWAEVIARQWPVTGAVAENGAIAYARVEGRLRRFDTVAAAERSARRARLASITEEVQRAYRDLEITDDSRTRETDVTFDIGEHRHVGNAVVQQASTLARRLGARVVRSSVHLHLSLDGHDKASGTLAFLHARHGLDAGAARGRLAFIGDSENDAPCFAAFETTIAVRNLRGRPTVGPRYVTQGHKGAGFVEAARVLVDHRR